jgi:hypothetical protein
MSSRSGASGTVDEAALRVDESRKLREYCRSLRLAIRPPSSRSAYLLLGSRASELVKRDVRDLDDGGALLWIDRSKTVRGRRRLAIPDELRGMLLELVRDKAPTRRSSRRRTAAATRLLGLLPREADQQGAGSARAVAAGAAPHVSDLATEAGELGHRRRGATSGRRRPRHRSQLPRSERGRRCPRRARPEADRRRETVIRWKQPWKHLPKRRKASSCSC